jgi:hypothetical protein
MKFPQYRILSNGKSWYEICSENSFNEIQIIGNKRIMFQLKAETYFEKIKISDMLAANDPYQKVTLEEFINEKLKM